MCCKKHNKENLIVNDITKEIDYDFLCMSFAIRFPLLCHWQCDSLCFVIDNVIVFVNTISFAISLKIQFPLLWHLQHNFFCYFIYNARFLLQSSRTWQEKNGKKTLSQTSGPRRSGYWNAIGFTLPWNLQCDFLHPVIHNTIYGCDIRNRISFVKLLQQISWLQMT